MNGSAPFKRHAESFAAPVFGIKAKHGCLGMDSARREQSQFAAPVFGIKAKLIILFTRHQIEVL